MARPRKYNTKKTKAKPKTTSAKTIFDDTSLNWMVAFVLLFFGVTSLLAETDSRFGEFLFNMLNSSFGEYYKFIFSPVLILLALFLMSGKVRFNIYRLSGLMIFFVSISTIVGYFKPSYFSFFNIYPSSEDIFGPLTTLLFFVLLLLGSLVVLFKFSYANLVKNTLSSLPSMDEIKERIIPERETVTEKTAKATKKPVEKTDKKQKEFEDMILKLKAEKEDLQKQKALEKQKKQLNLDDAPKKIQVEKVDKNKKTLDTQSVPHQVQANPDFKDWELPRTDLLDARGGKIVYDEREIREKELEIEEKLLQFKIQVDMQGYNVGPTVIQYKLKPSEGVKLQKIVNLKKDLTLALHAKNIRIQAPIPGQGVVGIEVPNDNRQTVGLKELIESKEFNNKKLEIPIAVGKDVSGGVVVGDLTRMPHLLVAGQTASGKSVGMNGFLVSMLYRFSPSELKMIMVDPKRVELSVYNGIPHLLTPVITDPGKALNALKWCVAEMLRRYDLATSVNARNLPEYNAKVSKKEKLPYIVVVIDELADLMMSGDKKEVEGSIARIAQMARAVGMHLIVATQRPSVDVITGLIKANVPSRIAFTVASQIDSRTIIDKQGAEDLLGRGDMLYFPTGVLEPERVQGVLVETHEVEAVVNRIKMTVDPESVDNMYDRTIVDGVSKFDGSIMQNYDGDQEEDPAIIEKAIQVVKESKKGSTSLIQRKLGLGYARAAKVLDILEELGVVGPSNGSKPRDVYVD